MEETLKLLAVAWIAINVGFVFGALWGSRWSLSRWPQSADASAPLGGDQRGQ